MKKLVTILAISSIGMLYSQENAAKNEIKLNLLNSIIGAPEVTYERLLANNQSVGISAAVSLDSKENLSFNYGFAPYYRIYFGKKDNAGFFVEANTSVTSYNFDNYTYYYANDGSLIRKEGGYINEAKFGFGAAIGFKLMTKNNLIGEVFGGVGRRFGSNYTDDAFPRIGITLGKRF